MKRLSQAWYLWIWFPILACAVARADTGIDQKWKAVRDHQPPGLQLKLTLPITFGGLERVIALLD